MDILKIVRTPLQNAFQQFKVNIYLMIVCTKWERNFLAVASTAC